MALKPLFHTHQPIGTFDGLDSVLTGLLGGEVVGLTTVSVSGSDQAAADSFDGYNNYTLKSRPAVTNVLLDAMRPLFLADEGVRGYGTLFGEVVGASVGKSVTGGTQLGPHTTAGSGKVTCWGPGMYAVTLDAVDATVGSGLHPSNPTLTTGDELYAKLATGKLSPVASGSTISVVARFIEFTSTGSLGTTPLHLVNSLSAGFIQAVVHFNPGAQEEGL